ncbi:BolA/IbaG family iron-sulfur metabolism protein [uncultured Brevundimonas sp.]|uniref:BolA/IbaG family iron-sulfur metabolism protein n=1 Tax=uncultured Brevundimonas sp. TaxID=213418 RepID=UPI002617B482|nr:BolA/IbaG family iron-sulfur metabolism protein [uncultured Brevundimonas sp.]
MPMSADDLRAHLIEAFPDAVIELQDTAGDEDHWQARVVSSAFEGMSRVNRYRACNSALKGKLGTVVHSVSFDAKTPAEVG